MLLIGKRAKPARNALGSYSKDEVLIFKMERAETSPCMIDWYSSETSLQELITLLFNISFILILLDEQG